MVHSDRVIFPQWSPRAEQEQDKNTYQYTFQHTKQIKTHLHTVYSCEQKVNSIQLKYNIFSLITLSDIEFILPWTLIFK